jgi:nucleotide-binding universal stress UspA family protein
MSPIRSLLLHLDASPRSAWRLQIARALAQRLGASVTAMLAIEPRFVPLQAALLEDRSSAPLRYEIAVEQRRSARLLFDRAGAGMQWAEVSAASAIAGFVQRALCADLLVLGQHDPEDRSTHDVPADFVASVLIASGKPALVLPHHDEPGAVLLPDDPEPAPLARCVVVAWRPTPEAARALAAALPLLRMARQVHVLASRDEVPVEAMESYLRAHEVPAARLERFDAAPHQAGVRLLDRCGELGADLLVMGCYGHARARELVLGGASRSVLKAMTVPVLMSH